MLNEDDWLEAAYEDRTEMEQDLIDDLLWEGYEEDDADPD